jgi:hypothetical protein
MKSPFKGEQVKVNKAGTHLNVTDGKHQPAKLVNGL